MRWLRGCIALAAAAAVYGQSPSFLRLGRGEGLPHEQVRSLAVDARGYLWIGTAGSVCRHDGLGIVRWPAAAGAPDRVDRIAHLADGRAFLGATGPRLWHYDPCAQPCFRELGLRGESIGRNVAALAVDGGGTLFVATEAGLFRAAIVGDECLLQCLERDPLDQWYGALGVGSDGALLYARAGLALRRAGDREQRVSLPDAAGNVWEVVEAAGGCLVLGDRHLLAVDWTSASSRQVDLPRALQARCTSLAFDHAGATWVGSVHGLWLLGSSGDAPLLPASWVHCLAIDPSGDLWVGTQGNGLLHASARPFRRLACEPPAASLVRLLGLPDRILVMDQFEGLLEAAGDRLVRSRLAALPDLRTGSTAVADARGNLWFGDGRSLLLVPGEQVRGAELAPRRFPIGARSLCRDLAGRVVCGAPGAAITVELDEGGALRTASVPLPGRGGGRVVGGDGRGTVHWCDVDGALWLLAADGARPVTDRGRPLRVRDLVHDRAGRTWIVPLAADGIACAEAPLGAAARWRWLGADDGLPPGRVDALAVAADGALWCSCASGLCRVDVAALPDCEFWAWPIDAGIAAVHGLAADASGRVFVASDDRVLVLEPSRCARSAPARVLVTDVLLAGVPLRLPDGGSCELPLLEAPAGRGALVVTWRTPGAGLPSPGVQYRLLPQQATFGAPAVAPTVQLAGLAAGEYRLELRVAAADGRPPGPVTAIELTVARPFWAHPWFGVGTVGLLLLAAVAWQRLRLRRLLAMEAVRRQIATDLHDDLGSGLAQVAALSELAQRDAPTAAPALAEIGGLARNMREAMSDIVWAVDPSQDTMQAVVQRWRQVAANLFADAGVDVRFELPEPSTLAADRLLPDQRRHLFLFVKEALTNAARHSGAAAVVVEVRRAPHETVLVVADNGRGCDLGAVQPGHGLAGMRDRAAALGARLEIRSAPGAGMKIELHLPG
jgi:signal transduction histidine kinase